MKNELNGAARRIPAWLRSRRAVALGRILVLPICALCLVWLGVVRPWVPTAMEDLETPEAARSFEILTAGLTGADTHPLENSCQFPVLHPDEESIAAYVSHPRRIVCQTVQPPIVSLDDEGILRVDQMTARKYLRTPVTCEYRGFNGSLRPDITNIKHYSDWIPVKEPSVFVPDPMFEVRCQTKEGQARKEVFRNAWAQVRAEETNFSLSNETNLSLDIVVLDSTSRNMFVRHMPRTWKYMRSAMDFIVMNGYNKVADNSMVNLFPVLAGLRFVDQTPGMLSDLAYGDGKVVDLDEVPFLWKDFKSE